jgi:Flp pilus assembly protein TadG
MRALRRVRHNLIRSDRGAAAVEFALLLPVLILLVFGIVEFGRAYNLYLAVTHAAREGARIASVRNGTGATDGEIKTQIADRSAIGVMESNIEITPGPNFKTPGQAITVLVHYPVTLTIPLFGDYAFELKSEGIMRIE